VDSEKLIRIEESNKNAIKRLDSLEKKLEDVCEITMSIKEITMEVKQMREDVNKVESKVQILEEKPGKRWEGMISQIISLITAGIVGYFLSKIGI